VHVPDFNRGAWVGANKTYKGLSATHLCVLKKALTEIQSIIFQCEYIVCLLVFNPSILAEHSHSSFLFILLNKKAKFCIQDRQYIFLTVLEGFLCTSTSLNLPFPGVGQPICNTVLKMEFHRSPRCH